jgi:hypothetical protein
LQELQKTAQLQLCGTLTPFELMKNIFKQKKKQARLSSPAFINV